MGELRLIEPNAAYEEAYKDFYRDWITSGESIVPWVVKKNPADFESQAKLRVRSGSDGAYDLGTEYGSRDACFYRNGHRDAEAGAASRFRTGCRAEGKRIADRGLRLARIRAQAGRDRILFQPSALEERICLGGGEGAAAIRLR